MSFQIFNNKKLINKNLQSNLSRTVIIYTVNSNKSVWSVYKLCQGIHHPPETERWQSAERNKMAAVEQKKLGNISCKLQQFFLWNVGYLFNVKKNKKKTGGWTWSVWFAQAWHRFISSSLRSVPCFLGLFFLGLFFFFRQCMKASTCESLCVMESHNGSIITLKPRRAECDCKMCVCKCVCVHVFMCVFVGTCYGDYTVRGLCWCQKSTAILHCCMMGMPFTSYIWAKKARQMTYICTTSGKVQRPEQTLVKNGGEEIVKEGKPEDEETERETED